MWPGAQGARRQCWRCGRARYLVPFLRLVAEVLEHIRAARVFVVGAKHDVEPLCELFDAHFSDLGLRALGTKGDSGGRDVRACANDVELSHACSEVHGQRVCCRRAKAEAEQHERLRWGLGGLVNDLHQLRHIRLPRRDIPWTRIGKVGHVDAVIQHHRLHAELRGACPREGSITALTSVPRHESQVRATAWIPVVRLDNCFRPDSAVLGMP